MADNVRVRTPQFIDTFCSRIHTYSYFEAIRVAKGLQREGLLESFSVEPDLTMKRTAVGVMTDHPQVSHAQFSDGHLTIYSSYLALFGYGSLLPEYVSRRLLEQLSNGSVQVLALLQFVNARVHRFIFDMLRLRYPVIDEIEYGGQEIQRALFLRAGLQTMPSDLRRAFEDHLERLAPLFLVRHRGVRGVGKLIKIVLGIETVKLYECDARESIVHGAIRPRLGEGRFRIGSSSLIGNTITDSSGNLRIHLEGVGVELADRLVHDNSYLAALKHLAVFYAQRPLKLFITFALPDEIDQSIRLGSPKWNQLGRIGRVTSDARGQLVTL